jgi:hypothetical protein
LARFLHMLWTVPFGTIDRPFAKGVIARAEFISQTLSGGGVVCLAGQDPGRRVGGGGPGFQPPSAPWAGIWLAWIRNLLTDFTINAI